MLLIAAFFILGRSLLQKEDVPAFRSLEARNTLFMEHQQLVEYTSTTITGMARVKSYDSSTVYLTTTNFTDCFALGAGLTFGSGGAVFVHSSALAVIGMSSFKKNRAIIGGAICCEMSDLYVGGTKDANISFEDCEAMVLAGAVYTGCDRMGADGKVGCIFNGVWFKGCKSKEYHGGVAVSNIADVCFEECKFIRCSCRVRGGGLGLYKSNATLFRCAFMENECNVKHSNITIWQKEEEFLLYHGDLTDAAGRGGAAISAHWDTTTGGHILTTQECCFVNNVWKSDGTDVGYPGWDIIVVGNDAGYKSYKDRFWHDLEWAINVSGEHWSYKTKHGRVGTGLEDIGSCLVSGVDLPATRHSYPAMSYPNQGNNETPPPVETSFETISEVSFPLQTEPPENFTRTGFAAEPTRTIQETSLPGFTTCANCQVPSAWPSTQFTASAYFHDTKEFSVSADFTASKNFTYTSEFTESTQFTISSAFTMSGSLAASESFTDSVLFTASELSASVVFSVSSQFTESTSFVGSNSFTVSSSLSVSEVFAVSESFTESVAFSDSNSFVETKTFTASTTFTASLNFDATSPFTPSNHFSSSVMFSESVGFTSSVLFSESSIFTVSSAFSESAAFTVSKVLSASASLQASNAFTKTGPFSATQHFTHTNSFISTYAFTQSGSFTAHALIDIGGGANANSNDDGENDGGAVAGVVAGIVAAAAAILVVMFVLRRKSANMENVASNMAEEHEASAETVHFPMDSTQTVHTDNPLWSMRGFEDNTDDPFRDDFEEFDADGDILQKI